MKTRSFQQHTHPHIPGSFQVGLLEMSAQVNNFWDGPPWKHHHSCTKERSKALQVVSKCLSSFILQTCLWRTTIYSNIWQTSAERLSVLVLDGFFRECKNHTVDGRYPKQPVGVYKNPVNTGLIFHINCFLWISEASTVVHPTKNVGF